MLKFHYVVRQQQLPFFITISILHLDLSIRIAEEEAVHRSVMSGTDLPYFGLQLAEPKK
jgi:hypothetical protein